MGMQKNRRTVSDNVPLPCYQSLLNVTERLLVDRNQNNEPACPVVVYVRVNNPS